MRPRTGPALAALGALPDRPLAQIAEAADPAPRARERRALAVLERRAGGALTANAGAWSPG